MKKIYILALSLTVLTAAFAQSPYDRQSYPNNDNRNNGYSSPDKGSVYNNNRNDGYSNPAPVNKGSVYVRDDESRDSRYDHRYNEQYSFSIRERDAIIFNINQEYARRMDAVQCNRFMRNGEKRRALRSLEEQRNFEIRKVYERFNDNRNKFNDRYYDRDYNWRH